MDLRYKQQLKQQQKRLQRQAQTGAPVSKSRGRVANNIIDPRTLKPGDRKTVETPTVIYSVELRQSKRTVVSALQIAA